MNKQYVKDLKKCCQAYEKKLIQLMGEKAFYSFSMDIAYDLFSEEVHDMENTEFRQFCIDNFKKITGRPYDRCD